MAILLLGEHRDELNALDVPAFSIFGSAARNDARPMSDVDLLVEFDGAATFDRCMDLQEFLSDLFRCPADLLTERVVRPELRERNGREAVRVVR